MIAQQTLPSKPLPSKHLAMAFQWFISMILFIETFFFQWHLTVWGIDWAIDLPLIWFNDFSMIISMILFIETCFFNGTWRYRALIGPLICHWFESMIFQWFFQWFYSLKRVFSMALDGIEHWFAIELIQWFFNDFFHWNVSNQWIFPLN